MGRINTITELIRQIIRRAQNKPQANMNQLRIERLQQANPRINLKDAAVGWFGCLMRTYQSVAEESYSTNLTADEINLLRENLIVLGAIRADMYVLNPEIVINSASHTISQRLKCPQKMASILPDRKNIDINNLYTIIQGEPVGHSGYHYKLGDGNGVELWNPAGNFPTKNDVVIQNILVV